MHLIGEQGVGIFLFVMLAFQGGTMMVFARRFLQVKPEGRGIVIVENYFNTTILILFIPLIAVSLIIGRYQALDLTHLVITTPWLIYGLEAVGIALIICGTAMIVLGFIALGTTFQPGGFAPRPNDPLVTSGIYSWVRHPLNVGVLSVLLGLALLVQSLFVLILFIVYFILVLRVISIEESHLSETFGEAYLSYSRRVRRLVPFIY
ncbi:MAG: isoprenylcysteine carboxylmethyltransferase family protein [Deltaproteobacteria bacterium]|uniref:Isoprenylcysteine carboxylmethyltransferase family protein n=1 Tax=Candidatus Zymogenus saltonus TaxID=2844893 RepID=A0A9D8PNV6_9DELT|nr:isoprenylcysteine carboxylmethyltransferase family protein [Candidatus Zymogenus saltonus]